MIGTPVIYVDTYKVEHAALVTSCFGKLEDHPSLNLVYVSDDVNKTDTYGRQLERQCSCCWLGYNSARANGWKLVGEEIAPYEESK